MKSTTLSDKDGNTINDLSQKVRFRFIFGHPTTPVPSSQVSIFNIDLILLFFLFLNITIVNLNYVELNLGAATSKILSGYSRSRKINGSIDSNLRRFTLRIFSLRYSRAKNSAASA